MTVFVICEAGSDISQLSAVLSNCGLRVLNAEDTSAVSKSIVRNTLDLIAEADLICAHIREQPGSSVLFELGYAIGKGLPVVLVGTARQVPFELSNQFWIRASLDDPRPIAFQLKVFLDNLNRPSPAKSVAHKGSDAAPSELRPKLVTQNGPHSELERQLMGILRGSSEIESIVSEPAFEAPPNGSMQYRPDFAIWLRKLPTVVGNPCVIELRGAALSEAEVRAAAERLQACVLQLDAGMGILLTDAVPDPAAHPVVNLSPLVFAFSLTEFSHLVHSGTLTDTLRRERNRFAHSAG